MLRPAATATGVLSPLAQFLRPRPALPAVTLFILGILAHRALPPAPAIYLAMAATATLLAYILLRRPTAIALLALSLFTTGLALAQLRAFHFPRDHIARHTTTDGRLAWLEVELTTAPRLLPDTAVHYRNATPRQHARATVRRAKTWSGWEPCTGDVTLLLTEAVPALRHGHTIRILGHLHRPPPAMNPGQFDWADYCRHDRILASVTVRAAANVTILSPPTFSVLQHLRDNTRALLSAGFPQSAATDVAVLKALVLGDSDPLVRDTREDFQRTGGAHLLAVSGLHVAVLAVLVHAATKLLRLSPRAAAWTVAAGILLYGLVAQPNPPVLRAIILSLAFMASLFLQRKVDPTHLLCAVGLALLAWSPLAAYETGFQLSFGCVLALMLFATPMKAWFTALHDRDVAVAESFRPPRGGRKLFLIARNWFEGYVAAGLVAWAVSLPMVAAHFSQLNPWALVAGVPLSLAVFAALVAGILKILLTLAVPVGASYWATGTGVFVHFMSWLADLLAAIPGSNLPLRSPPVGYLLAYYALIAVAFVPFLSRRRVITARLAGALALLAFTALPFATSLLPAPPQLRLTLLSVGAGQCCIVEAPGAEPILIDAGSSTIADPYRSVIAPYFQYTATPKPDRLILTHEDHDHVGAAASLTADYPVRATFASPHVVRLAHSRHPAADLLRTLSVRHLTPRLLRAGDRLPLNPDSSANLEVLWPPSVGAFSANDAGLVLKLTYAGRSILLPADIQTVAQSTLLQRHRPDLKADVLVAPHHGSSEVTTAAFLRAVAPTVILSSDDRTPTRKQLAFDEMAKAANIPLHHTHAAGALTVTIDPGGNITVTPFRK